MKNIETLVDDIYALFGSEKEFNEYYNKEFGERLANTVANRVPPSSERSGDLRMSMLGQPCERKLWYTVNFPELGIPLTPATRMKFLYGDILEELLLYLAVEAGHTVKGMQDEIEIAGTKGHRDAIIDGMLVDVKSASSYSFARFAAGLKYEDDKFGYIPQLQQYLYASQDDPLLVEKDRAAFLVIDKTLGKICLDIHEREDTNYHKYVELKKELVASPETPNRGFKDIPEGASGNRKLDVNCQYCDFKKICWPDLRTFLYYNGPRFLTKVVKTPNVEEVT